MQESCERCVFKHLFQGSVRSHHRPEEVRRSRKSSSTNSGGRKIRACCLCANTSFQTKFSPAACVGVWTCCWSPDFSTLVAGRQRSILAIFHAYPSPATVFFKHFKFRQPTILGFYAVFLDLFMVQRCFVNIRAKFSSRKVFFMKRCRFTCNILFFWYFSDYQRLIQVRSTSMTNIKPSGGFVCHYYHNPGHVR